MSDADLLQSLEDLDRLLQESPMDPEALAAWRAAFETLRGSAERGPAWPALVARAHLMAARMEAAANLLAEERDQLRKELNLQAQGSRALKGYKPT